MLALLAAVLAASAVPYIPVTCQTGYVATYRGGRVQCVSSILQSTTAGAASTAATATGLSCSSACVQDAEIQSLDVIKTTGWPTCPSGQALTASGSPSTPACTSTIKASDLVCSACVASGEIASVDLGQVSDTAAGEVYEVHLYSTVALSEAFNWYAWTTGDSGVCERMTCSSTLTVMADGVYRVTFSFSGYINADSQVLESRLFLDSERQDRCGLSDVMESSGYEQAHSWTCLLNLRRDEVLSVQFLDATSSGKTLTIAHANLNASRVL